jgi:hypothetical protein
MQFRTDVFLRGFKPSTAKLDNRTWNSFEDEYVPLTGNFCAGEWLLQGSGSCRRPNIDQTTLFATNVSSSSVGLIVTISFFFHAYLAFGFFCHDKCEL